MAPDPTFSLPEICRANLELGPGMTFHQLAQIARRTARHHTRYRAHRTILRCISEMHEIPFTATRSRGGLNCGPLGLHVSASCKKFRNHPKFPAPDRAEITNGGGNFPEILPTPIQTATRRDPCWMGGMAAQVPHQERSQWRMTKRSKRSGKIAASKYSPGTMGTWWPHPGPGSHRPGDFPTST